MKRPIAELRIMAVPAGAEAEWLRDEHEMWQILRRKQGYVTHRIYQALREAAQRLVYSEWDSKKALDGARQQFQGTPLARRMRAALAAPPERSVVELVGPITSTKGLDLPETAVAVTAITHLPADVANAADRHARLGKLLASQPGHITHVLFRGFDDPALLGAFSHWQDATGVENAVASVNGLDAADQLAGLTSVQYHLLRT